MLERILMLKDSICLFLHNCLGTIDDKQAESGGHVLDTLTTASLDNDIILLL